MGISVAKLTNPYFGLNCVTNTEEYGGCTGLNKGATLTYHEIITDLKTVPKVVGFLPHGG